MDWIGVVVTIVGSAVPAVVAVNTDKDMRQMHNNIRILRVVVLPLFIQNRKENERKIEKYLSMMLKWYVLRLFILLFILFLRCIDFSLFMDILNMDHH